MADPVLTPWLAGDAETDGRFAYNQFACDGLHVNFGINFDGVEPGYLNRTDIKWYTTVVATGISTPVQVVDPTAWQSDTVIHLVDTLGNPFPLGTKLSIFRDTAKNQPANNFSDGSVMDEENLDTNFEQAIYAVAEMVDKFNVTQDGVDTALEIANEANVAAAEAQTAASAAQTAALGAQTAASDAATLAGTANANAAAAVTTANGIAGTANTALTNANAAVTTANDAAATANGIAGTANTALTNANAAVTTANNAASDASTALTTANGLAASIAAANATAGQAASDAAAALALAKYGPIGQCRFLYVSATSCALRRYNGQYLIINGSPQVIPSAGVSISNSGLVSNTLYNVYAYMSSGTMTLEASTTTPAVDAATGIAIKSGDSTRTLVGMVVTTSAAQFEFSTTALRVASYFNRIKHTIAVAVVTGTTNVSATSPTAIGGSCAILCWGDSYLAARAWMNGANNTGNAFSNFRLAINAAASGIQGNAQHYAANSLVQIPVQVQGDISTISGVGQYTFTALCWVSGGTLQVSNITIYAETEC